MVDIRIAIVVFIVAALATWLIINLDGQVTYDLGCCTINGGKTCGIECTADVVNECCEDCIDVRLCSGQLVQNPEECFTKYCIQEQACKPVFNIALDGYTCTCKDIEVFT